MSARDWFELAWHASLLLLATSAVLRSMLRHGWARALFALAVIAALAYHLAIVQACHQAAALCYWGGSAAP